LGILPDGSRDILGLWIEHTEGAKFWLKVFNDLKTRGVEDVLIAANLRRTRDLLLPRLLSGQVVLSEQAV
jgi:hypothetical protein